MNTVGQGARIRDSMQQVPLPATSRADLDEHEPTHPVWPDVAARRVGLANVVWLGSTTSSDWVLVEACLEAGR